MSWLPVHVRRDNKSFLHLVEEPIANHLAEELNRIETEQGRITYVVTIDSSEDHVLALVQVSNEPVNPA
jgi:hypothetical protein